MNAPVRERGGAPLARAGMRTGSRTERKLKLKFRLITR